MPLVVHWLDLSTLANLTEWIPILTILSFVRADLLMRGWFFGLSDVEDLLSWLLEVSLWNRVCCPSKHANHSLMALGSAGNRPPGKGFITRRRMDQHCQHPNRVVPPIWDLFEDRYVVMEIVTLFVVFVQPEWWSS